MLDYKRRALELIKKGGKSSTEISNIISSEFNLERSKEIIKKNVRRWRRGKCIGRFGLALSNECEAVGIPIENVNHYWYKGDHFSIHAKGQNEFNFDTFRDELIREISEMAPEYRKIDRVMSPDPHCLVFNPADIHIGKLCSSFETGETYNSQIAVKRVREGLNGILQKSAGWNINKVIFVVGNDVLHTDTPKKTTTGGTTQDTDGMWYDNFIDAKKLLIEVIEVLMGVAPVEVVYNPSNHDFMSGFMLIQTVEAWFSKCEDVIFNSDMSHRKYTIYGHNIIGTSHGDGAKTNDLALLMAHESKDWVTCKHRYFYTGHLHHKVSKDIMSVCVETLRSPSGTDGWHHRKGYQHAPKACEAFIHHPLHGQVARITHLF